MRPCAVAVLCCSLLPVPAFVRAADGDLDPSFGGTGVVSAGFSEFIQYAGGLALQPDGKIVVAGMVNPVIPGNGFLALARLLSDGTPDATFGTGGRVTSTLSGVDPRDVVVHPDGSLYVLRTSGDVLLSRFSPSGDLDLGFGVGGVVTTDCGGSEGVPSDFFFDVGDFLLVQPDGKLVAAASNAAGTCVVRYEADGTPDAAFGTAGVASVAGFEVHDLMLQNDGKILIAGRSASLARPAVARLQTGGAADPEFGDGGIAVADLVGSLHDRFVAVASQPDGRVVATTFGFTIARYRSDGRKDTAFGDNGIATNTIVGDADSYGAVDLAIQADGKLLIGGTGFVDVDPPAGGTADAIAVVRFENEGSLDASYGSNGVSSPGNGRSTSLRLQPDGKVVAAAHVVPPIAAWFVTRLLGFSNECPATPAVGCKTTTAAAGASLKIRNVGQGSKKNQLQWKWKGDATTLADFDDPVGGDDYALCLYDAGTLASRAVVAGGGTCKGKPCWKPLGTTGLGYSDSRKLAFGIGSIKLTSGAAGAARVQVKSQGAWAAPPDLPLASPVLVQLTSENGACWEAAYTTPTKNDGVSFQAKSDE